MSPRVPKAELPDCRRFRNVVIGAGYTGLATARRLAELNPEEEVLLLEASTIGEGASGRNSGYLLVNPGEPSANAAGFTETWAKQQMGLVEAGFNLLRSQVETHKIECDWNEKPLAITAAATPRVEKAARSTRETYLHWGLSPREYHAAELALITGTDYYRYGLESLTRGLVQPAALHRGLADNLPACVRLVENISVKNLSADALVLIETDKGSFRADRVFVTNNFHAQSLGIVSNRMVGIYTYGALTPELGTDQLALLGAEENWGILPAHRMGTTMRRTNQRLLIRSGDSYEREMTPMNARKMLTALYRNRFPAMNNHELEYVWGGLTAVTQNGGFFFGRTRPNIYASVGCGGAGVVRGTIQGKLLADMAYGFDSDLLRIRLRLRGPNWLPPEPLRYIGAKSQIKIEQLYAGRDR